MSTLKISLWCVTLLLLGSCLVGCSLPTNPQTSLAAGPWGSFFTFKDTKDNDILIKGAEYNPETKQFKLSELTVRNNSSDVRIANVEQIKAYTAQVEAFTKMVEFVTQAVATKLPNLGGTPAVSSPVNPVDSVTP